MLTQCSQRFLATAWKEDACLLKSNAPTELYSWGALATRDITKADKLIDGHRIGNTGDPAIGNLGIMGVNALAHVKHQVKNAYKVELSYGCEKWNTWAEWVGAEHCDRYKQETITWRGTESIGWKGISNAAFGTSTFLVHGMTKVGGIPWHAQ